MPIIQFNIKPVKTDSAILLVLPLTASSQLPSRGMTMVAGTVNGIPFKTPLEPDGKGSHLLVVDEKLRKEAGIVTGDTVSLEIEPSKDWPEPEVPEDLKNALSADPKAKNVWTDITPMARWDWIRWIRSTKNPETRQRRIEVACSKMGKGSRRPCCFNRTECTLPFVWENLKEIKN